MLLTTTKMINTRAIMTLELHILENDTPSGLGGRQVVDVVAQMDAHVFALCIPKAEHLCCGARYSDGPKP